MMNGSEFDRMIALSTAERLDYDSAQTWTDLFQEQVHLHPERMAVAAENGSLSYGELDRLSDRLAMGLIGGEGVQPDEFIAVRMGRVKEFHVAVLAIHKAGAAYVPVDPAYPEDRIAYMLEDSESRVTLDEATVARVVADGGAAGPVNRTSPDHRAYMIYTSGSTGKPKGVMIRQRALRAYTVWAVRDFGYQAGRRYAHSVTFSFDASVTDIVCPLSVGAELHVLSNELRLAPPRLADPSHGKQSGGHCGRL